MEIDRRHIGLLFVVLSIIVFDRVEFLYYGLSHPEKYYGFLIKGDPIRADSYIYFASIRIQYIIFAALLYVFLPEFKKPLKIYFWVSILYFIEYFLTYNEPIVTIPLTGFLYIPVSVTFIKYFVLAYLLFDCINKTFFKNDMHY